eukprot:COSAG01_NODE_122_length_25212_cov_25.945646_7_plen_87_part_00
MQRRSEHTQGANDECRRNRSRQGNTGTIPTCSTMRDTMYVYYYRFSSEGPAHVLATLCMDTSPTRLWHPSVLSIGCHRRVLESIRP